jgi:hypothetical protein
MYLDILAKRSSRNFELHSNDLIHEATSSASTISDDFLLIEED